uniref:Retrotransposon Copia-like N-terminal domain-containing protein n=1 Tax=Cajanus cajan TaxID=3821 RepID=A0A151TJC1_CAJCA|nr:hypothetical protein KK1_013442 [Cajanus cajan]
MEDETHSTPPFHSFLYLHPGENPATALVSPVLDSGNYHSWSRSMLTALSAKNKMEFVDGNAPQPPKSDVTYSAWRRCNNMVVSWLVHSVSPSIRQSILWMDKTDEIWNDLKSRYSQDPTCSCTHKCSCNVLPTIAQRKREDQAMQFLRGLNEQYSNVRSHVLLMDPIPPISKIFSYVAQQERQLLGSNFVANTVTKTTAINATASSFTCTHCGKSGHTENLCYRKHGFPSNHDNKSNRGASNRSGKICIHCGRNGHTIDVCYRKHGFPPGYKSPTGKTSIVKKKKPLLLSLSTAQISGRPGARTSN